MMVISFFGHGHEDPAQEEKDKALQRATRVANHSLAVTLSGGGGMDEGLERMKDGAFHWGMPKMDGL